MSVKDATHSVELVKVKKKNSALTKKGLSKPLSRIVKAPAIPFLFLLLLQDLETCHAEACHA